MINTPSIGNCDILRLGEQIHQLIQGKVKMLHIDLMDGHYVPNLYLPISIVKTIKEEYPDTLTDIHLMVDNPQDYIDILHEYGADYVSFHMDSTNFSIRLLRKIRSYGMKAGVVINPSQRMDTIEPIIDYLDYVVQMTVEPGFAGQKFMDGSLERLEELDGIRRKHGADFLISVDGGIDYPNSVESMKRGADILITGIHTVFNQPEGLTETCLRFSKEMKSIREKYYKK